MKIPSQPGDFVGEIHGSNFRNLKNAIETGEQPRGWEVFRLWQRIKSIDAITEFDTPNGGKTLAALLRGNENEGVSEYWQPHGKYVYLIAELRLNESGETVWLAGYTYDGRRMGLAHITLNEDPYIW